MFFKTKSSIRKVNKVKTKEKKITKATIEYKSDVLFELFDVSKKFLSKPAINPKFEMPFMKIAYTWDKDKIPNSIADNFLVKRGSVMIGIKLPTTTGIK